MNTSRSFHLAAFILLAALTAVLYAQTLDDEWHFDDRAELEWPGVRDFSPTVSPGHYRGVVPLWLWAVNFRISGEDPWSYHLLNVTVHAGNAMLAYAIAWMLGGIAAISGRRRPVLAAATGAIFAAHPMATQAVTYLTQRSTSVAALSVLASFALYLLARDRCGLRHTALLVAGALTFFAGLHTKHVALVLPAVLLLFEGTVGRLRPRPLRTIAVQLLPFLVVAAVRVVDWLPRVARPAGQIVLADQDAPNADPAGHSRFEFAVTQVRVVASYLRLLVLPRGQNLDHDPNTSTSLGEPAVLLSAVVLLALLGGALFLVRRRPLVSFGLLFFFLTLAPTSSFVPSRDLMNEHRVYLPLFGFALALAAGVAGGRFLSARVAAVVTAVLVLALGGLTHQRNRAWNTELSLWTDAAAKSPRKARPRVNLGLALQNTGWLDEAADQYLVALEIEPGQMLANNNLGNIRRAQGDAAEAERLFRRAIETRPRYAEPHINLGNLATDRGDVAAAQEWYEKALELQPKSVTALYNLAKCFEQSGDARAAIAAYEGAVALRPENPQLLNDLGCAHFAVGELAKAERHLREAVGRAERWAPARFNLGLVLEAAGRDVEAVRELESAAALDPSLAAARQRADAIRARSR